MGIVIQSSNHDVQRKPTEHHASAEASGETKRHIPTKGCVFMISCGNQCHASMSSTAQGTHATLASRLVTRQIIPQDGQTKRLDEEVCRVGVIPVALGEPPPRPAKKG